MTDSRLTSLYKHILESLYDGVYYVDVNRKIRFWNEGAVRLTGFKPEEIIGRYCHDNILDHVDEEGNHLCTLGCPLTSVLENGRHREIKLYLRQKNGLRRPVSVRATPLYDDNGTLQGAIEIFSDASEEVNLLKKMRHLESVVNIDHLTGIGNRKGLEENLRTKLAEFKKHSWLLGLSILDIDNFKIINDTYGHETGDRVLQMVARTLATSIRSFDFVGRWGGEEFITLLNVSDSNELRTITNRHRILIKDSFVEVEGKRISVTASFGSTVVQKKDNLESIVARADKLLYQSKQNGKNCITFG